jgi:sucrose-6F-phosphate phosphohydrolase
LNNLKGDAPVSTKPFLFVTDLDHTLVGDDSALEKLNQRLAYHRDEYGTRIVYATGRSIDLYKELEAEKNLLTPDALISSVGTEIYSTCQDKGVLDLDWFNQLSDGWNRDLIVQIASNFAQLTPQIKTEQRQFKASYHLDQQSAQIVLPQLDAALRMQNLKFKFIYSTGKDLDIIPYQADKGLAVKFIQSKWSIAANQTVVCGDSGNDIALFEVDEVRGIIVGNASSELQHWLEKNTANYRYRAKAFCAAGILEGLHHFAFLG